MSTFENSSDDAFTDISSFVDNDVNSTLVEYWPGINDSLLPRIRGSTVLSRNVLRNIFVGPRALDGIGVS